MPKPQLHKNGVNNKGFSVVELLIVVAIVAILGTITIGPMLRWRTNSMIESQVNTIMADLERSKMEAIRRSRNVVVEFTAATDSYRVFIDRNGNGTYQDTADANGVVDMLLFNHALSDAVSVTVSGGNTGVSFTPRGAIRGLADVNIVVSPAVGTSSLVRTITVNRIGNITSTAAE